MIKMEIFTYSYDKKLINEKISPAIEITYDMMLIIIYQK